MFFNQPKSIKINSGFSLVELMVSLAIIAIISVGINSVILHSQSQYSEIKSKVENLGYQQLVIDLVGQPGTCSCQFKNIVFNSNNPAALVPLSKIKKSCAPGASALIKDSLNTVDAGAYGMDQIYFTQTISTGNSDEFSANLMIQSKTAANEVKSKPIPIPFTFHTDPASPANAKIITGCGPAPLTDPSNLTVVPGNGTCSASWSPSSGGTPITYTLKSSTVSGAAASTGTTNYQGVVTSSLVTGLTNNTTYYFTVQASNYFEISAFTAEVSCKPLNPPSTPSLTVTANTLTRTCAGTWTSSTGSPPNSYQLKRSTVSGGASAGITVYSGPALSFSDSALPGGLTYYYTVKSSNPLGSSSFSAESSCVIPACGVTTTTYYQNRGYCNFGGPCSSCPAGSGSVYIPTHPSTCSSGTEPCMVFECQTCSGGSYVTYRGGICHFGYENPSTGNCTCPSGTSPQLVDSPSLCSSGGNEMCSVYQCL